MYYIFEHLKLQCNLNIELTNLLNIFLFIYFIKCVWLVRTNSIYCKSYKTIKTIF